MVLHGAAKGGEVMPGREGEKPMCICGAGFGMNLSCPEHKPDPALSPAQRRRALAERLTKAIAVYTQPEDDPGITKAIERMLEREDSGR